MNSVVAFARQRHQHEVRFHRLRRLIALLAEPDFAGDRPEILAVVEHVWSRHVVQAVHGCLQLQHQLRIAHVAAQVGRHLAARREKASGISRDRRR